MTALDFSDLPPDSAPDRGTLTRALDADADPVVVSGPVSALGAVLAVLNRTERLHVGVSWVPSQDPMAAGMARTWGVDAHGHLHSDAKRTLGLVRDDHGGVLLAKGRLSSLPKPEGTRGRTYSRFGAQIYHDERRVADGEIMRVDVRPDWTAEDRLKVNVHRQLLRRGEITFGRAIQVACDEARVEIDGVPFPRPVTKWTWYADHRFRWNLIST